MRLIGTAGHIDHGKSQLVEALTGTQTAHLPEEKERGMTVNLGFASLGHPEGFTLGIVDVPGHEDLVKNMVAGATGFALALWVVDAREGVMPQSREHLHVLDLLGVRALVPVLTKADLADEDEIAFARVEAEELLAQTMLSPEPFHTVDSVSGRGVEALREAVFALCGREDAAQAAARPYLPIDRAFSLKGVGTVVTGTLVRGRLEAGQDVALGSALEAAPGEAHRIRSLTSFYEEVDAVGPGQRVGVNLAGLGADEVARGDVLVAPGHARRSRFLNARLRILPNALHNRKDGLRVLFHAGSAVQEARLWGLDPFDLTEAGERAWAQLELPAPMPFHAGQRFVLRSTNPLRVAAGGEVLDLSPDEPRVVTFAEREAYRRRLRGTSTGLAAYAAEASAPVLDLGALARRWMLSTETLIDEAHTEETLRLAEGAEPPRCWRRDIEEMALDWLRERVEATPRDEQFASYDQFTEALGIAPEHFPSFLNAAFARENPAAAFLRENTRIEESGLTLYPGETTFMTEEERLAEKIEARLEAAGREPPRLSVLREDHADRADLFDTVIGKLRRTGRVVPVENTFLLAPAAAEELRRAAARHAFDGASVADVGDALGLSRKYTIPYLDWLGAEGLMHREGDRHFYAGGGTSSTAPHG